MSFSLILSSECCNDTHPENTANKYVVDFDNTINLHGPWEAALTDFSFIFSPVTIQKGNIFQADVTNHISRNINYILKYVNNELSISSPSTIEHSLIIGIDHGIFKISSDYEMQLSFISLDNAKIYGFNSKIITSSQKQGQHGSMIQGHREISKLGKEPIHVTVSLKIPKQSTETFVLNEDMSFESYDSLCSFLKFRNKKIFKTLKFESNALKLALMDNVNSLLINSKLAYNLGLTPTIINEVNEKIYHPRNVFKCLNIYTSLIEPILVGDAREPLLRSVTLDKLCNGVISVRPKKPMYIPVASSSINTIKVYIQDDSGKLVEFGQSAILTVNIRRISDGFLSSSTK